MDQRIKKHWNDLADINEDSYKTSWEDYYMLQKEIDEVCKYIKGSASVCDIGCNNGYCDFELLKRFSNITLTGIDYAEKAIEQATNTLGESCYTDRCNFLVGNILNLASYPNKKFDIVLVKRTIINLDSEQEQITALTNLKSLLDINGKIILMEAVEENLIRLNNLRREFSLPNLPQPWHNKYLSNNIIKYIYSNFNVDADEDYSSSYYVISRVILPWLNKTGYLTELHRLATMLPNVGDYGVQRVFVLSNK